MARIVGIALLVLSSAHALVQLGARCAPAYRSALVRMQLEEVDTITLKLTKCLANGIGIGLDDKNKIDMIKPDGAGSKAFLMGDEVMSWNNNALWVVKNGRKEQRKLVEVVEKQDEHTVVVKRLRKPWASSYEQTSWEAKSWDDDSGSSSWSGGSSGADSGSSWGSGEQDPPDWA